MKLFVNDKEISVFNGATVIDALRTYYVNCNKELPKIMPVVIDEYGNSVAPDGELTEGNRLHIETTIKP